MHCSGNHLYTVIYRQQVGYGVEHVVRWCQNCGGVVVDADIDGQTDPGRIARLRIPEFVLHPRKEEAPNDRH